MRSPRISGRFDERSRWRRGRHGAPSATPSPAVRSWRAAARYSPARSSAGGPDHGGRGLGCRWGRGGWPTPCCGAYAGRARSVLAAERVALNFAQRIDRHRHVDAALRRCAACRLSHAHHRHAQDDAWLAPLLERYAVRAGGAQQPPRRSRQRGHDRGESHRGRGRHRPRRGSAPGAWRPHTSRIP